MATDLDIQQKLTRQKSVVCAQKCQVAAASTKRAIKSSSKSTGGG